MLTKNLAIAGNHATTGINDYFKQLDSLHSEISNDLENIKSNEKDVPSETLLSYLLEKEFAALDRLNDLQFRFNHFTKMK